MQIKAVLNYKYAMKTTVRLFKTTLFIMSAAWSKCEAPALMHDGGLFTSQS